jgi:uncharacterized protein (TIGR00255 family)
MLSSMTGFARASGQSGPVAFSWELRSVNGRGLEVRLKMPPGFEAIEAPARDLIGRKLKRGNVQVLLTVERSGSATDVRIDERLLLQLAEAARKASQAAGLAPPTIDALLAIRGVVETGASEDSEETRAELANVIMACLEEAVAGLVGMRQREGLSLHQLLAGHIDRIEMLTNEIAALPQRRPDAIRARLAEQVRALMEASGRELDPDRLHQEAALIAARGDVAEELDRLSAHVAHARGLLAEGGAVGRKLDFLAQEFNREANTTCSKSSDRQTTALGLDLKATIEQMREQVQNLE